MDTRTRTRTLTTQKEKLGWTDKDSALCGIGGEVLGSRKAGAASREADNGGSSLIGNESGGISNRGGTVANDNGAMFGCEFGGFKLEEGAVCQQVSGGGEDGGLQTRPGRGAGSGVLSGEGRGVLEMDGGEGGSERVKEEGGVKVEEQGGGGEGGGGGGGGGGGEEEGEAAVQTPEPAWQTVGALLRSGFLQVSLCGCGFVFVGACVCARVSLHLCMSLC